jgi:glycerol-3-phosphate acyltransferase PlsY
MITLLIIAYLLGSVNSAVIVCKLMELPSPNTTGSKNPGATNVLRIGGKKAAAFTFTGDALKGIIAVLIGHFMNQNEAFLCWIGLAAVIGHIFPIFFKFKGGKGVATAIGASIAIEPILGICIMLTWFVIAMVFRYSSLAAIIAFLASPAFAGYFLGQDTIAPFAIIAVLIIIKHKQNIKRLLNGTESRIGTKK